MDTLGKKNLLNQNKQLNTRDSIMTKMKKTIKRLIERLPYVKKLQQQIVLLRKQNQVYKQNMLYPPGHFYSPIVDPETLQKKEDRIWKSVSVENQMEGLNLNVEKQINLLKELSTYYAALPFVKYQNDATRYHLENDFYSYIDGIILYSVIRYLNPKRIIEIGSGFSSAVMLDTNTLFFDNKIQLTFIEPYPNRLYDLMTLEDNQCANVIVQDAQEIDVSVFEKLEENDILFIDSTHVAKTGSDVNYILFDILPKLKKGVWIHFHDVFYPFEYPKEWVYQGRNWNEDYILRAFLMYNTVFEIKLFAHYLHIYHPGIFSEMPLCYKNLGGNIWIQKVS